MKPEQIAAECILPPEAVKETAGYCRSDPPEITLPLMPPPNQRPISAPALQPIGAASRAWGSAFLTVSNRDRAGASVAMRAAGRCGESHGPIFHDESRNVAEDLVVAHHDGAEG